MFGEALHTAGIQQVLGEGELSTVRIQYVPAEPLKPFSRMSLQTHLGRLARDTASSPHLPAHSVFPGVYQEAAQLQRTERTQKIRDLSNCQSLADYKGHLPPRPCFPTEP